MKKIELHEAVKNTEEVLGKAKELGLDQVEKGQYTFIKTKSKNPSPYGYKDGEVFSTGTPYMLGNEEASLVWFFIQEKNTYATTSPVLNIKKTERGYEFETENSLYKMDRV